MLENKQMGNGSYNNIYIYIYFYIWHSEMLVYSFEMSFRKQRHYTMPRAYSSVMRFSR
uniref:Uncharacterized protein n=1 Tax=Picea glauca TaxID=3330 RepID=A0A101M257_PICGL|nr:hypothetical protein ABT39_MTgene2814 [Picea glauca]